MEKKNEIMELSFEFALVIIKYAELIEEHRQYVIPIQLLKSGKAVGFTSREAHNAHSRNDIIAKCVIAAKEADETEYWLMLCQKSKNYPSPPDFDAKDSFNQKAAFQNHFIIY